MFIHTLEYRGNLLPCTCDADGKMSTMEEKVIAVMYLTNLFTELAFMPETQIANACLK